MATHKENLELLVTNLRKLKFGMLSTVDKQKQIIRSRPMMTHHVEDDGTLWFMTSDTTSKAREINADEHVNVSYADASANTYVSVSGIARLVQDKKKIEAFWQTADKAWYPKGQDDPHIVLVRVDITDAEYWDGPNKVVELYALAKAVVTGTPPVDIGQHARLTGL